MLKIYGSMLCKDCVQCRADLGAAGIPCLLREDGSITLDWAEYM